MVDGWLSGIIAIIGSIITSFVVARNEDFYAYLKKRLKRYTNDISKDGKQKLSKVKTPYEIKIGSFTNISAKFDGTVKRGFLSCKIVDCLNDYNWCENRNTVMDLGSNRQTGTLNFENKKRKFEWSIQPKPTLTKGKGKLIIGVFEEKDIVENGLIIENHPHVALEEREVLLC